MTQEDCKFWGQPGPHSKTLSEKMNELRNNKFLLSLSLWNKTLRVLKARGWTYSPTLGTTGGTGDGGYRMA